MRRLVLSLVCVTTIIGCTYHARLYDMADGGAPLPVTFKWSGTGRGRLEATLPSGERCVGEYRTLSDDSMTWGSVFAAGAVVNGYAATINSQQRGAAIATGPQGTVIECEYVTSASSPSGYGSCRDNSGKFYKLMF